VISWAMLKENTMMVIALIHQILIVTGIVRALLNQNIHAKNDHLFHPIQFSFLLSPFLKLFFLKYN
jgi:hypothetical protein